MPKNKGLYIASTGQHVGKTTTCLGLFDSLKKTKPHIGYMKPVGQEHIRTSQGKLVDKDVLIFEEHFALKDRLEDMSPVLIPAGFTRNYLDGKINKLDLEQKILHSFERLAKNHPFILVEGTGHSGVGTIIDLNNAQVAHLLGLPILLIASGGLGSAFDELTLNKTLCDTYGVQVLGVILNRVRPEKHEMVVEYMSKALQRWNIPLLGCIPFDPLLSNPSMKDFEQLFQTTLVTGEKHLLRHFKTIRLVATSLETYREMILPSQLIITPANREDIILATLTKYWDHKQSHPKEDLEAGMILTGDFPPRHHIIEELKKAEIPMLYTPAHSSAAMQMITTFTAKIRTEDVEKVREAITLVENHIDVVTLKKLLFAQA